MRRRRKRPEQRDKILLGVRDDGRERGRFGMVDKSWSTVGRRGEGEVVEVENGRACTVRQ